MHAPDTVKDAQISRCRCRGGRYNGWTLAANDGASRLSAYFDRIVTRCDECGARISIPAERVRIPLDRTGRSTR